MGTTDLSEIKSIKEKKSDVSRLQLAYISTNVTEEHLREIFAFFGSIHKIELQIDRKNHLHRGNAFIEFEKQEEADRARLHMNGAQVDGKIILVQKVNRPNNVEFGDEAPRNGSRSSRNSLMSRVRQTFTNLSNVITNSVDNHHNSTSYKDYRSCSFSKRRRSRA